MHESQLLSFYFKAVSFQTSVTVLSLLRSSCKTHHYAMRMITIYIFVWTVPLTTRTVKIIIKTLSGLKSVATVNRNSLCKRGTCNLCCSAFSCYENRGEVMRCEIECNWDVTLPVGCRYSAHAQVCVLICLENVRLLQARPLGISLLVELETGQLWT